MNKKVLGGTGETRIFGGIDEQPVAFEKIGAGAQTKRLR
jgi:hypothetical protein